MSVSEALSKSILDLEPLLSPNGNEYIPIAIQIGSHKLNFKLSVAKLINLVPVPTKQQIGLGNVDNTSDFDKPISSATQSALNNKANTTHNHVVNDITDLLELLSNYELAQNQGTLEEINIGTEIDIRSWSPSILHQLIQTLSNKYVGDVPPDTSELKNGTEWFETTTGITYTWYINEITNKGCFVGDLNPSITIINNQPSIKQVVMPEFKINGQPMNFKFDIKVGNFGTYFGYNDYKYSSEEIVSCASQQLYNYLDSVWSKNTDENIKYGDVITISSSNITTIEDLYFNSMYRINFDFPELKFINGSLEVRLGD